METKQVGIWIRVSTEMQVDRESPEHHLERAKAYAKFNHWNVMKIYRLDAESGKSIMEYHETQEMLHDIRTGVISGLIFSRLARLARNTRELLEIADIFQAHQADLISIGEKIDTTSPAGRFLYTLIAAMAEWERENIAQRVRESIPVRAKLGKSLGGAPPFGYRREDHQLVPDPHEAPIRKLMFDLFLKYKRRNTVARELNNLGYRTRKGAKFSYATVDRLLTDPVVIGKQRKNYTRSKGKNKAWEIKDEKDWIIVDVPAIVPEALYTHVNTIITEQQAKNTKVSTPAKHLFTGYLYCHCGARMYVKKKLAKYVCKKCKNKIPMQDLEDIFMEQLHEFVISPHDMSGVKEQTKRAIHALKKQCDDIKKKKKELYEEISTLIDMYKENLLSKEDFTARYEPIKEQQDQVAGALPRLEAELASKTIQVQSVDDITTETQTIYTRWPTLERAQKRAFIELTVDRIIIHEDTIDIRISYMPYPKNQKQSDLKTEYPPSPHQHPCVDANNVKFAG